MFQNIVKVESACYELEKISVPITNPFNESCEFRIVLVEASGALLDPSQTKALLKKEKRKKRRIRSKIDSGMPRPETPPSPPPAKLVDTLEGSKDGKNLSIDYNTHCRPRSVNIQ